jgi:hypothetical protein
MRAAKKHNLCKSWQAQIVEIRTTTLKKLFSTSSWNALADITIVNFRLIEYGWQLRFRVHAEAPEALLAPDALLRMIAVSIASTIA